ncbi:MAG TPA: hypothetical protein VIA61_13185 [Methylomirabilota bacterium]|jgi:hypothetical protein
MLSELWYDLMVLEMSERSDPVKEKLIEAAQTDLASDLDDEEEPSEDNGGSPGHVGPNVCGLTEEFTAA